MTVRYSRFASFLFVYIACVLFFMPTLLFGQEVGVPDDVKLLVKKISFDILNPILSILFGAAFMVFLWGVAEYIWKADSDDARLKGRQHIIWGLVGMFIMFSAYAFVRIIVGTIGADVPVEEFN